MRWSYLTPDSSCFRQVYKCDRDHCEQSATEHSRIGATTKLQPQKRPDLGIAMVPTSIEAVQRFFRKSRSRLLVEQIDRLAARLDRPVRILDVGGRARFWDTVETNNIASIAIANIHEADISATSAKFNMRGVYADALDLSRFNDGQFDMVVSNSMIEHLGSWKNIKACAAQLQSVANCGYVQTPSFWFPIEQHFMIPFFHWLPPQLRVILLPYLPRAGYEDVGSVDNVRQYVEEINLVTGRELEFLFPAARLHKEKILFFTKSYAAVWDGLAHADSR